ncbi:MAG: hypothetical protein R3E10_11170 [Gemmatimonadota bacterium]
MSDPSDRREFLRRIAKTSAYAAPIIRTLAAPTHASAQVSPKMMGMGMMTMFFKGNMFMKGMPFMFPFRASPPPTPSPPAPWSPDVPNDD